MGLVVQKFGGTSVATAERIMAAARRAVQAKLAGNHVVMVVSARGNKTDELKALAQEITDRPPAREMDVLLSTGEQESVALVSMAVQALGHPAVSFTGAQVRIETDSAHTRARIRSIAADRIAEAHEEGKIAVVAGFQGVDPDGNITTLGRGASDTTAVALAAVLKADLCEIYTDVDGVFTANPKIVAEARKIERITYDEMLELAAAGAGVMHSRSIEFAKKYAVPVHVRNSGSDAPGTVITGEAPEGTELVVCGAAVHEGDGRITITKVPDRPGVASQIFRALAERRIVVGMIVQNVSRDGLTEVSFTVNGDDLQSALDVAEEAAGGVGADAVTHEADQAIVSVVGSGMRTHSGVAHRAFTALAEAGININMISTSDIKISAFVNGLDAHEALRALHAAFALEQAACEQAAGGFERRPTSAPQAALHADLATVVQELPSMEDIVVSGVTVDTDQASVILAGVPDRPGISSTIFSEIARGGVIVDMICQNVSTDGLTEVAFTVPEEDRGRTLLLAREVCEQIEGRDVLDDAAIAKVDVHGVGVRTNTDVAVKMFAALAAHAVNIKMITTSEVSISVVVDAGQATRAAEALHEAFGLNTA